MTPGVRAKESGPTNQDTEKGGRSEDVAPAASNGTHRRNADDTIHKRGGMPPATEMTDGLHRRRRHHRLVRLARTKRMENLPGNGRGYFVESRSDS